MYLHFVPKPLLKKIIRTCSCLKWHQSKKCTICVKNFWNKYIFAAAFEKQPFRNISKINLYSEAAIKMHFSILLFCTCGEVLWKKNSDGVQFLVNSHVMLAHQKFHKFHRKSPLLESVCNKVAGHLAIKPATLLKRDFNTGVILWNLQNF